MFLMYAVIAVFNSLSVHGRSRYHSLSAQRLSESTVFGAVKYHTAVIIQKLFSYSITDLLPKKSTSLVIEANGFVHKLKIMGT